MAIQENTDQGFGPRQAVVASGVANITLAESLSPTVSVNTVKIVGDDFTDLTRVVPVTALTYAFTDNAAIVAGNVTTTTTTTTQSWYMG